MFSRRRIISHLVLWSFVGAGVALAFHLISPSIIFKKSFNRWLAILPLGIFFVYHVVSAAYYHCRFHPDVGSEKRIIRAGMYGKCLHPTCTSLVILSWMLFFYAPDARILFGAAWLTGVVFFWINVEKTFFLGRRSKAEAKRPEPV